MNQEHGSERKEKAAGNSGTWSDTQCRLSQMNFLPQRLPDHIQHKLTRALRPCIDLEIVKSLLLDSLRLHNAVECQTVPLKIEHQRARGHFGNVDSATVRPGQYNRYQGGHRIDDGNAFAVRCDGKEGWEILTGLQSDIANFDVAGHGGA